MSLTWVAGCMAGQTCKQDGGEFWKVVANRAATKGTLNCWDPIDIAFAFCRLQIVADSVAKLMIYLSF